MSAKERSSMEAEHVPKWTLRRTIPSNTAISSELAAELIDAMMQRDWPASDLFRVQLAYEEAVVNAIRHGNRHDVSKTVHVEMACNDDEIWIRITDQGPGFDPNSIPDPRIDELIEIPGGRGVLLISEIMSEITYNEQGNQITMIKRKADASADGIEHE
ncbi:Serine/threonine-protein kinase BtrW [Planctomycetes bacterium CA13]|uniref:Serine/threonine-protein kinase BtrW n=1 Tax=Novipirellula herctigrandis TaxID=2527986 RepID=A0A5C5YMZ3_9BACT|nr:Serine/threonine-protein kinase BtrW [Planctomycetes bacterium CA13]